MVHYLHCVTGLCFSRPLSCLTRFLTDNTPPMLLSPPNTFLCGHLPLTCLLQQLCNYSLEQGEGRMFWCARAETHALCLSLSGLGGRGGGRVEVAGRRTACGVRVSCVTARVLPSPCKGQPVQVISC